MLSRASVSKPSLSWVLSCILLITFCVAGGASRSGVIGQVVVRGVAIGVLVAAIVLGPRPSGWPAGRTQPAWLILLAAIALVLLQLVPLPPAIWVHLPGRTVFEGADTALGQPLPWRPLAIVPDRAVNAALSLLAPLAMLVAVTGLSAQEERQLPGLVLCLVLVSTLVAVLQFSGAGLTNPFVNQAPGDTSGLFANRNHFALWLTQGCLLVPAWALQAGRRLRWRGPVGLGLLVLFALMILASGSRAGIVLGLIAVVGAIVLARWAIAAELRHAPRWVGPAATAGAGAMIAIVVLVSVLANRAVSIQRAFAVDATQDIRTQALPTVLAMIRTYMPVGAGAGSFDAVFRLHEPLALLKPTFFNHAHNDVLEIVLDTGLAGLLVLVAALAWWGWASVRAWRGLRRSGALSSSLLPCSGSALLLLVFVASLFDYPARTPLIMAMMVIAAAWLNHEDDAQQDNRDASALPRQVQHL